MIVKCDLKRYADQAALPDEQQIFMDASVETVDGDIVFKFKKLLVEEGENDIFVDIPQNFIYEFATTIAEVHGPNRYKSVMSISSCERSKLSDC